MLMNHILASVFTQERLNIHKVIQSTSAVSRRVGAAGVWQTVAGSGALVRV